MWVITSVSCFLLPTLYVYDSVLIDIVFGIFINGYLYLEPPLKSSLNFGQLDYFPDLFL